VAVSSTYGIALLGLSGIPVLIEADITSSLPSFHLVGLPDASLSEATARVRSACANSNMPLPPRRITVNLSPASVPKHGSAFDLGIAVAILSAAAKLTKVHDVSTAYIGELALDGSVRGVRGVLAHTLAAVRAGFKTVIVPEFNLAEARCVEGIEVVAVNHLSQVMARLGAPVKVIPSSEPVSYTEKSDQLPSSRCMSEIRGQSAAVDAAVTAAAGGHHMSLIGTPGSGKTMIAERLSTILPDLDNEQAVELAAVRSLLQRAPLQSLNHGAPFESPHHSASLVSLIGGGSGVPKPGLISLAHHGVLFLDEAPEFATSAIDALRQPLEAGRVTISRSTATVEYPARFQLILAANPCPCGKNQVGSNSCNCPERLKSRYLSRISGPVFDRIDIQLRVRAASNALLAASADTSPTSAELACLVQEARARASRRLAGFGVRLNSQVSGSVLRKELRLAPTATNTLDEALKRGQVSMRGYDKCLRLAWTNADMAGRDTPIAEDVGKAIWLRGIVGGYRSAAA